MAVADAIIGAILRLLAAVLPEVDAFLDAMLERQRKMDVDA